LFEFVIPVYDPVIRPIATSVSSLGSALIAVKEIEAENRTSLLGSQGGRTAGYNIGNSCCVRKKKKDTEKHSFPVAEFMDPLREIKASLKWG
jgi:hypothetical protein